MNQVGANPITRIVLYLSLIIFSAFFLLPILTTISSSLNVWGSLPTLIPTTFQWENFKFATTMIDFWGYTANSVKLIFVSVAISTIVSGMTGYAFARIHIKGKNFLFMIILSTMMLPGIITQIPLYILLHKYNMLNSYVPFWLMWGVGGSALSIFLYRQFFSSIPSELEEAARIDGCSIFGTYLRIFLPVSVPVMITVTILNFQAHWGDSFSTFMFMKREKYTLAAAMANIGYFKPDNAEQFIAEVTAAGTLLLIIPVIVLFFFGQRHMAETSISSAVKG